MPNTDTEVFEHLLSDQDTPVEIDYLTYAVYAYKKKQWCDHHKARDGGQAPTQQEIDAWIGELTDYDFAQLRNEAVEFFHDAAEEHLHDYIEDQKRHAVNDSILSAVKEYSSPWRHFFIALIMAIVAPVFLGGLLFFIGVFDSHFPVHVTVGNASSVDSGPRIK